jgi:hypothetical protein
VEHPLQEFLTGLSKRIMWRGRPLCGRSSHRSRLTVSLADGDDRPPKDYAHLRRMASCVRILSFARTLCSTGLTNGPSEFSNCESHAQGFISHQQEVSVAGRSRRCRSWLTGSPEATSQGSRFSTFGTIESPHNHPALDPQETPPRPQPLDSPHLRLLDGGQRALDSPVAASRPASSPAGV